MLLASLVSQPVVNDTSRMRNAGTAAAPQRRPGAREWLTGRWLRRAYAHVKENHGCAGADGVTLAEYERELRARLAAAREAVEGGSHWAWPLGPL